MPPKTSSAAEKKKETEAPAKAATVDAEVVQDEAVEEQVHEAPCQCDMDALIRKYTYGAVGIGFIPVPLVDLAGLTALQLAMVGHLAKHHGVEFKKERTKSIITALCGGSLTVLSVPLLGSLFKAIPVVGQTMGATTISITGAATTYAIGCVFDQHFKDGGNLITMKAGDMKESFTEYYKKGEKVVKERCSRSDKKDDSADVTKEAEAAPA
ncbi:MAG: YcjF family protein [Desulfovibrio sp.]